MVVVDTFAPPEFRAFVALGDPVPQGSLTRSPHGSLYHGNAAKLGPWRALIAGAAVASAPGRAPLEGPVRVSAWFTIRRPKAHFGTGRNATRLRDDAPPWWDCQSGGDVDKLLRALLDAMTGVVYRDDRQVVELAECGRSWAHDGMSPGVRVRVEGLRSDPLYR